MKHAPRKRFGQHFLRDKRIIQQLIHAINPAANDCMVEIGPGKGVLTDELVRHALHLHLIELDRDLVEYLRQRYSSTQVTIYQSDILKFDISQLLNQQYKLRLVGNLPYNISTPLLFHVMEFLPGIDDMHFMLQKEVVSRLVAQPGESDYGRLSVMLQYYCEMEALFDVPPESFSPPPKVNSAVIRLIPHRQKLYEAIDPEQLSSVVRIAFSQRRKTIKNNLRSLLSLQDWETLKIDSQKRPQALDLQDYVSISNLLSGRIEKEAFG